MPVVHIGLVHCARWHAHDTQWQWRRLDQQLNVIVRVAAHGLHTVGRSGTASATSLHLLPDAPTGGPDVRHGLLLPLAYAHESAEFSSVDEARRIDVKLLPERKKLRLAQVLLPQAEFLAHQDTELFECDAPAAVLVHALEERKEVSQVGVHAFEGIV